VKVRLGDVCQIKQGVVKDTSNSVWLLNLDNVESETGKIIEFQYVDPNKIGTSTCQFDTGNVLYSKLRPYLNKVVLPDKEGFATSEMLPIRPDTTRILREYLTYYLRSPEFVACISDKVAGAKMPRARTEDLLNVKLQLPTLDEQTEIVKILNIVSNLITQRNQQLCQLDELIKSQFIELFGDPVTNPKGWKIISLQELLDCGWITYHLDGNHGGEYPRNEEFVSTGVPYISANCIVDGQLKFNNAKYITPKRAKRFRKGLAKCGDVLFAHNATVGPVSILETEEPLVILGTSLTSYRCNQSYLLPTYLKAYMESWAFIKQYESEMQQTTRKQVPITTQRKYYFVVPPIDSQKQFATFVEQTDKSKFAIQKSCDQLANLKKSLMQQYFA